jgi:hypothetical protein
MRENGLFQILLRLAWYRLQTRLSRFEVFRPRIIHVYFSPFFACEINPYQVVMMSIFQTHGHSSLSYLFLSAFALRLCVYEGGLFSVTSQRRSLPAMQGATRLTLPNPPRNARATSDGKTAQGETRTRQLLLRCEENKRLRVP